MFFVGVARLLCAIPVWSMTEGALVHRPIGARQLMPKGHRIIGLGGGENYPLVLTIFAGFLLEMGVNGNVSVLAVRAVCGVGELH